jgi:hypothetical protein
VGLCLNNRFCLKNHFDASRSAHAEGLMVHNTRREAARVLARFQKQIVLLRRTTAEAASVEHTKLQVREGRKSTEDDWQGFPYPKYSFDALVDLLYGRQRIQRAMQEVSFTGSKRTGLVNSLGLAKGILDGSSHSGSTGASPWL